VRIGINTDLNWKLCDLWKLPFRKHRAKNSRRTAFALPIRVPISFFRLPSLVNTTPSYLNISINCSAFPLTCRILPWASWETQYLNLFSGDFRSCLVARSRIPIKCLLKTLLWRSTHAVPIRPQKANGSSCGSQLRHPLSTVLASGKDAVPASKRRAVVYEIPSGSCEHRYIGETKRSLSTRLKEHHRDTLLRNILKNPEKTALTKHETQSGHAFNWDYAHALHHVNSYNKRIFL